MIQRCGGVSALIFFSASSGHAQVVQAAGYGHGLVHKTAAQVAEGVGDDAAPFHPGDGVLHAHSHLAMTWLMAFWMGWSSRPRGFFLGWRLAQPGGS